MRRRCSILVLTVSMIALAASPAAAVRATIFKPTHPLETGSLHPAEMAPRPAHCPSKFPRLWAPCAPTNPGEHIPGH